MFRVRLDNENMILDYVSGKIRRSFIRILPGDRVKIEVSGYDSTRGRIIYRLSNKDSKCITGISRGPERRWFTLRRMSAVRVHLSPIRELSRYKAI
ncbi:hypothetical protein R6Q57_013451 [Mikania cordata]